MLRLIGGVVFGYIVMGAVVFAGLSAAFVVFGPDRAFQPGVYDVSLLWVVTSLAIGFGAALIGGWLARTLARTVTGPRVLAAVVVVLGLALALSTAFAETGATGMRTGEVGPFEAMQQAHTPLWIMLLNPLIGAAGVLIGGRAIGRRSRAETDAFAAQSR